MLLWSKSPFVELLLRSDNPPFSTVHNGSTEQWISSAQLYSTIVLEVVCGARTGAQAIATSWCKTLHVRI